MMKTMIRDGEAHKIVIWHGEHKTVYYHVKYPTDNEWDWEVVGSFPSRELAQRDIEGDNP